MQCKRMLNMYRTIEKFLEIEREVGGRRDRETEIKVGELSERKEKLYHADAEGGNLI